MEELLRFDNIKAPLQMISWVGLIIFGILVGYYLINIGNRYLERSKRIVVDMNLVKKVIIGVAIFLLAVILLRKYPIIGRVLATACISIILAYVLSPLVDRLEKRGINRVLGVIIVYLTIAVILIMLIIVVVPKTTMEIRNLVSELPRYADSISDTVNDIFDKVPVFEDSPAYETIKKSIDESYQKIIQGITGWITNSASSFTTFLSHFVQNFISVVLSLLLIMIMTFYFLIDKRKYADKIQRLIPDSLQGDIFYLGSRINTVLTEFIRGRIILAVFVGVFTGILLLVLGIDFAIVIGIVTCIADIIPYIGPLLGFIPAFLFALIQSPIKALVVALFYVLIQWAENNLLAPKIIGDSMGLNPLFIFLSIVIGGGIFGVWGMVIAIPLAAIGLILIEFFRDKYKLNKLNKEKDGKIK